MTARRVWRTGTAPALAALLALVLAGAARHERNATVARTWYPNGQLRDARSYRGAFEHGVHRGWWEDGTPRFEATYVNGRREGVMRQWNRAGMLFHLAHYRDGAEHGTQQMWNEDGSLRANYVVRDGRRYGYMGAVGCTSGDATDVTPSARTSAGGGDAAGR
ncbi:MAG: hypothetical protein A2W29_06900 [Gemmatimonadetes bacterium RBG_16_66_8]|nr:MAG: hypothetical protein A2W29_06900 [Gemmatimonadetes bacterium RBG_16_66_8]